MQAKRVFQLLSTLTLALTGLTLLLGAARAQEGPHPSAPQQTLSSGFTYQGAIQQNGTPPNGACDIRFSLFDSPSGGLQVGSTQTASAVALSQGRFIVTLNAGGEFGPSAFTGQMRWLAIAVRCPTGSGSYAALSPRQPLTAVPYAIGLQPGAVISASLPEGNALTLGNSGYGSALSVPMAGVYGVSVGSAGGDGVRVSSAGWHGVNVDSAALNGVQVGSVGWNGVSVGSAGLYGMDVYHAGLDGLRICATGSASGCVSDERNNGIEVGNAEHNGVQVVSAGGNGLEVNSTNQDGVFVGSAGWAGLSVGSTGTHGMEVASASYNGVQVGSASWNGVAVDSASLNGVYVGSAGSSGMYVESAISFGTYTSADWIGAYANTTLASGEWGFYTPDKIIATNVTAYSFTIVAQVAPGTALEAGQVVAAVGLGQALPMSPQAVPLVGLAQDPAAGLAGVVESRVRVETRTDPEGHPLETIHSVPGLAQPGEYVLLTVAGVAYVQVEPGAAIIPGMRLTTSDGLARPLQTREIDGMLVTEGATAFGAALEPSAADKKLIAVFVSLR